MDDPREKFVKTHMPHQGSLFGYLLGAVRDFHQAEDLLQQVTLILWKKFGEYRADEPYLPWAFGVARRELARHFRDSANHEARLSLEIMDAVTGTLEKEEHRLAEERRALLECIKKLPAEDQGLVKLRYETDLSLKELADRFGKSLAAVNMALVRIRRALLDCTERSLTKETVS